jgi:hypothetical protein
MQTFQLLSYIIKYKFNFNFGAGGTEKGHKVAHKYLIRKEEEEERYTWKTTRSLEG